MLLVYWQQVKRTHWRACTSSFQLAHHVDNPFNLVITVFKKHLERTLGVNTLNIWQAFRKAPGRRAGWGCTSSVTYQMYLFLGGAPKSSVTCG